MPKIPIIKWTKPSSVALSDNRGEDKMQLLGFVPNRYRFTSEFWARFNDHSNPVFRFSCLFTTVADLLSKLLLRTGVVGFAIICADARRRTNNLADERLRDDILRNRFGKTNDRLAEQRGPFFQIIRLFTTAVHDH
ncbi:MAG: hypothetical protein WEB58_09730 [Planctomycetaceae bacterium]